MNDKSMCDCNQGRMACTCKGEAAHGLLSSPAKQRIDGQAKEVPPAVAQFIAVERPQLVGRIAELEASATCLTELQTAVQRENDALRRIISECATACGAAVSVECSLEFMAMLPKEIALKAQQQSGVVPDSSVIEEVIKHMDRVWSGEADEDVTEELTRRLREYARLNSSPVSTGEAVAYRVTGAYTDCAFTSKSSAEAYMAGLVSTHLDGGYKLTELIERDVSTGGWIVGNGDQTKWRKWGDYGPEWAADKAQALQFARRLDAEAFAAEDEDAWAIVQVSAGGVDERAAFEAWHNRAYGPQDKYNPIRSLAYDSAGVGLGYDDQTVMAQFHAFKGALSLTASAPNHSEQVRELPPFAQKVIRKLKRFEECAEDSGSGGVDIGRHWLDLLTQLGLLNRVQRSPGMWEISQQGEDLLAAAPSAGSQEQGE